MSFADKAGEGMTFARLKQLAFEKKSIIIYGFPEKSEDRLFNSALAIMPDGNYHVYQKSHLYDTEKAVFDLGQSGFFVFSYNDVRIGLMICFDWRFPEAARKLALQGAQIICHPSNLILPHCPAAIITRALENNVFTITANRVGQENRTGDSLNFIGQSRIVGPDAGIIADLKADETGFLSANIAPELADDKAISPRNNILDDRRPDMY
jgi:predicted amidohydrolase